MFKGVGKFNFFATNTCKIIQGMMIIIYIHANILILGGVGGTNTVKPYRNIIIIYIIFSHQNIIT